MNTMRLCLAVGLLFGFAHPAWALDCAKASTVAEKAICGDPALKAQDAALSRFYFDVLRTLKGERHDLMIADQRRWLEEDRESGCAVSDKPSAFVPCLATNLKARRRQIAICYAGAKGNDANLSGKPVAAADMCIVLFHPACPKVTATASPRLANYPWLQQKLVADAKAASSGGDCAPESADSPGTPDQNETTNAVTVLTERPNLVSVRYEDDDMERGAAHPNHGERIVSYDTRTKAEIPITAILPGLKPGSALLKSLSKAADTALDVPCCGDESDHTFESIGLDPEGPMPSSWAVSADGDLILAYEYNIMAREFVATAVVPRRLFLKALSPKYADVFVAEPKAK